MNNDKKRILFIVNYFYPDIVSTSQILTELCEEIQDDFKITVIAATTMENKKEKMITRESYGNIDIIRVYASPVDKSKKISRLMHITTYFINSIFGIFSSGKQDLIFTISQPPILGGVLGVIAKRVKKAKLVYNIQDYNPEQIEAVGYSKSKFVIELARKIDNHSCKKADVVLVVGRDMVETLKGRFKNKNIPRNTVINNWVDEKNIYPLENDNKAVAEFKEKYGITNKYIFMYSGNIGLYYDLENIIKVIDKFKKQEKVIFTFIGDGAVKNKLVEYCERNNINNVMFIPFQDKADLINSLNAADVHIVTNAKGIKGVSVPSKIYGVMAAGKPVLGILEEQSEARILIEESKCGLCCEPGDYHSIERLIKYYIDEKNNNVNLGINGRKAVEQSYKKIDSINKYRKLFSDLL